VVKAYVVLDVKVSVKPPSLVALVLTKFTQVKLNVWPIAPLGTKPSLISNPLPGPVETPWLAELTTSV